MRRIVMSLLLAGIAPAMAQLDRDRSNDPPVHNETPKVPANPVPPSQINADQAAVSPVGGDKAKPAPKSDCNDKNPCAEATPASR